VLQTVSQVQTILQLHELTGTQVHTELQAHVPVLVLHPEMGFSPGCIIWTSLSGILSVTALLIWGLLPSPVAKILSLGGVIFFIIL